MDAQSIAIVFAGLLPTADMGIDFEKLRDDSSA